MKFLLSLDDYSPCPNTNNLFWANKLIEKFPDIKIDLFVSAGYCRLKDKYPYYLYRHLDWVKSTKELPNNYRINLHGLLHRRSIYDFEFHTGIESNNNEWENLNYKQASFLLDGIEKIFNKVDLKYAKVFRPPGFHIGKEAVKLLTDRGYLIAGSEKYYNKYKDIENLKWVSYNWDLITTPQPKENVYAFGHTSDWTNNYLNEDKYNKIVEILNNNKYEFSFIEELYGLRM
jgi:hypothetical protein